VVELATGKVFGHEAFARGPAASPLEMPGALFAVSGRLGVTREVDRLCRETALRSAAGREGLGKLFLNVSAESMEDTFEAPTGLRPEDVVLELSERLLDGDAARWETTFRRLRTAGFAVGVDDMGTGFVTRAFLERVRPDFIKADVSLVRGLDHSPIKQELLQSLVRIAGRVGAQFVAEGIENEGEVRALIATGARLGQGFWFASPSSSGNSGFSDTAQGRDH